MEMGYRGKSRVLDAEKARIRKPPVKQDRTGSKGLPAPCAVPRHGLPPGPPGKHPPPVTDGSQGADASAGAVAASRPRLLQRR